MSAGVSSMQAFPPITLDSLKDVPLSYATVSIGRSGKHSLTDKLKAISSAGFQAIELGFPDLVSFANDHLQPSKEITASDYDALCKAAREVKSICEEQKLKILMLQPFANFEGWPQGSQERKDALDRAEGWIRVMEALGCDMLQVGSTDASSDRIDTDRDKIVADLTELADLLAKKGMKVAYENWCWSTHAPDWDDVWSICKAVDRENLGLCLDTFQSAGGEWGDASGISSEQIERRWKESCYRLSKTVDPARIFLLQISDAYNPPKPFSNEEIDGLRPRARWSGDYRPLPFEGYLPVVDFTKAVLRTGFRGWFSYEIFDSGPDGKGKEGADNLEAWADAAKECQKRLAKECADE